MSCLLNVPVCSHSQWIEVKVNGYLSPYGAKLLKLLSLFNYYAWKHYSNCLYNRMGWKSMWTRLCLRTSSSSGVEGERWWEEENSSLYFIVLAILLTVSKCFFQTNTVVSHSRELGTCPVSFITIKHFTVRIKIPNTYNKTCIHPHSNTLQDVTQLDMGKHVFFHFFFIMLNKCWILKLITHFI